MFSAGAASLGALAAWGAYRFLTILPAVTVNVAWAAIGAAVGAACLGFYSIFVMAPGPIRVEVTSTGLLLRYSGGRIRRYDFIRPGTRVNLDAYGNTMRDGSVLPPPHNFVWGGIPTWNPLSDEAYRGILAAAAAAGWKVETGEVSTAYAGIKTRSVISSPNPSLRPSGARTDLGKP
jgi:hypothetical protein